MVQIRQAGLVGQATALMAVAAVVFASAASAELNVSVTITGPVDEMLPLLEHLKGLGVGAPAEADSDTLRVEMHSEAGGESVPRPLSVLQDARVDPATVAPGPDSMALISVRASDPDGKVDTVAARVVDKGIVVELYDNGSHGDSEAGDGVWSGTLAVADVLDPGEYRIKIMAYNANGTPVIMRRPGEAPEFLTAETLITVLPPSE